MTYVDELFKAASRNRAAFVVGSRWGHLWCHLWADDVEELIEFGESIGMRRSWLQNEHGNFPHFDLVPSKRRRAIQQGAIETTVAEWRHQTEICSFYCLDCKNSTTHTRNTDPTTSTGCCPLCGSDRWEIRDSRGVKIA